MVFRQAAVLSADPALRFSLTECTSLSSGPIDTDCMPGILELMIPHSRPACITVTFGFLPMCFLYDLANLFVKAESLSGSHAGYELAIHVL